MPRPIYIPIFDKFFESSIMQKDICTRFVMLALIRLASRPGANGEVDIDPFIFAQSINLPYEDVQRSIQTLMEPDPASSSPDEDGRRIVPVDPGRPFRNWRVVNWASYQTILHRVRDAARKRDEYHAAKSTPKSSESLQDSPEVSDFRATRLDETRRDETRRDEKKPEKKTLPTKKGRRLSTPVTRASEEEPVPYSDKVSVASNLFKEEEK